MAKFIRVNTKTRIVDITEIPEQYTMLGGRELTSTMLLDEVDPMTDPLGPGNKLIFATGLLAGTAAPNFSRLSIGAKSPLTGGIKESNVGGKAAFLLGQHDIRAIILDGNPGDKAFFTIAITSDGDVVLEDVTKGKSLGNYAFARDVVEKHGSGVAAISIGPAGANQVLMSSIASLDLQNNPSRQAARGGLGAVMGSKGIKAIIIEPKQGSSIKFEDLGTFKSIASAWAKELKTGKAGFSKLGTSMTVSISQAVQGLPTRNFSSGTFDGAEKISGETLHEVIIARGGRFGIPCLPGCAVQCSNLFIGPDGKHVTSGLEYETIAMNGSNLGIDDIDAIARVDHECDDIGIDTIEFGATMGVLMEAGKCEFGNASDIFSVLDDIRKMTKNGKLYSQGAHRTGTALGATRIPAVKKQAMSAYDPRTYKGMGVTFITSPMGADHTAGAAIYKRTGFEPQKDYGDVFEKKAKLDLSFELQVLNGACDMLGCCYFIGPNLDTLDRAAKLINARYGYEWDVETLVTKAKTMLRDELEFNKHAAFTSADDRLPEFFESETLTPLGRTWDITGDEIDSFWKDKL
ncbi:MAG TPA: aldehyde ferredoxin oxidoreductase C-terminal domain-containing protein [Candidatus Lokiarchaeia archaeon]|nr:aldehyde ferredoxin oxidoreductase C-terminal domain-containing protein [Candidatus Lokiarchaeia archaeon]